MTGGGSGAGERASEGGAARRTGARPWPRVVGDCGGRRPGPLVIAVGGIHGNEPAGVEAARQVAARIEELGLPVRGRFLALAGNLSALALGQRYVHRDLNRIWTDADLAELRERDPRQDLVEQAEQRELLAELERALARRDGPVVFLDLHSSSAHGQPFLCMGDTLQNRSVALGIPAAVILGLEENIDGALLEYFSNRGHVALGIEGGQHEHPDTLRNHAAALWLGLVAAGALEAADVPELDAHRARLESAATGLARWVEIRHRHGTRDGDGFAMEPGYQNFQPVRRGELLARDAAGEIRALETGLVLLPRYQGQGNDGFFLARRVLPVWLGVSAGLRRLGLERLLPWLPGVARHPELPESLRVDPRIARWRLAEIFHLFGYRRRRPEQGAMVFSRRREAPVE